MTTHRPKRPRDPAQLAKLIVDIATGEVDDGKPEPMTDIQKLAQAGGLKGGRARADALSPERRAKIASEAAKARWKRES